MFRGHPVSEFLTELKRRRVPQTALWYIGGAVALVEAANVFLPSFGVPDSAIRFLAVVAVFGLPIALTLAWTFDVSTTPGTDAKRSARLLPITIVAAVALISLSAAYAVWYRTDAANAAVEPSPRGATADPNHIAVLPFNVIGDDPDLTAFAAQLQARLIDGLSAAAVTRAQPTRRLRVVSRASVLPYARGAAPIDSIRDALNVGTVLEGTVEPMPGAVRVRVRLVDTQTGDQLVTAAPTAKANDRLALLEAVADSVVALIRTRLGTVLRDRMRLLETRNADAFDRLVWASQRFDDFGAAFDAKDYEQAELAIRQADSLFAEAERLDREWIEPILGRARMAERRILLSNARGTKDLEAILTSAIRHVERALAIRPADFRALQTRGYLRRLWLLAAPPDSRQQRDRLTALAVQDLRASLLGNPTPAMALRMLSELAGAAGRMEEAIKYGQQAYDEDPYLEQVQFSIFRLFEYSFALGRDADAADWCSKGRGRFREPIFDDCRLSLGAWSDAYPLRPDSAWRLVAAELSVYPAPLKPQLEPRLHAMAAAVLARNGQRDSALAVVRRARLNDTGTPGVARAAAGVYGLLDLPDSAFSVLRMLAIAPAAEREELTRAPELRVLRAEPRFQRLTGDTAN